MGKRITVVINDEAAAILERRSTSPRKQGEVISMALRLYEVEAENSWDGKGLALLMAELDATLIRESAQRVVRAANNLAEHIEVAIAGLRQEAEGTPTETDGQQAA